MEGQIESLQNELRDNLTQIDKLEYEVSAGARHHGTELGAARQRIADLEGQLAESRREADEYYKGNLEQTRLNEELERRLVLAQSGKKTVNRVDFLFKFLMIVRIICDSSGSLKKHRCIFCFINGK